MEQVLYQLPDGWQWRTIDKVAQIGADRGFSPTPDTEGNVPFIGMTEIDQETGQKSNYELRNFDEVKKGYTKFQRNAVLLAKITPCTENNKTALIDSVDGGFATTEVFPIHALDSVEPKYLLHFFRSPSVRRFLIDKMEGATGRHRVPLKALKSVSVPVCGEIDQKRIVEKLDRLLPLIDSAIEHLQESITLADAFYASELNIIFPSDTDIESLADKDGWVYLSDICTFENGDRGKNYPSKSAFVAEGIPVVSAGNLGERYIDHKGLNYIPPKHYDLLKSGRIKIGDILFCLRGSLGKVAISKDIDEGVIASSLVIIRPKDCVSEEYVYKYLKSSLCQKYISYYNNGAAQPNLSAKSLGKFMLPLPNVDEQKIIANGLDEKYQSNQKLLDTLRSKVNSLQSLKASILDSAFKGAI
jgi:type I restriction enzyme S subunit